MLSDVFIKHVREIVLALLDDWFIQQGAIKTRRQGITVRDMRWTDRNKERETESLRPPTKASKKYKKGKKS